MARPEFASNIQMPFLIHRPWRAAVRAGPSFVTWPTIAVIKPDLIRIARKSKLVRDKLSKMSLDDPELSPDGLHELEWTNRFTLAPAAQH